LQPRNRRPVSLPSNATCLRGGLLHKHFVVYPFFITRPCQFGSWIHLGTLSPREKLRKKSREIEDQTWNPDDRSRKKQRSKPIKNNLHILHRCVASPSSRRRRASLDRQSGQSIALCRLDGGFGEEENCGVRLPDETWRNAPRDIKVWVGGGGAHQSSTRA